MRAVGAALLSVVACAACACDDGERAVRISVRAADEGPRSDEEGPRADDEGPRASGLGPRGEESNAPRGEVEDRAGVLGTELTPDRVRGLLESARATRFRPVGRRDLVLELRLDGPVDALWVPPTGASPDGWRHEVAAYRVARCLGMDNVPPVVLREVRREDLRARMDPDFADVAADVENAIRWDARGSAMGAAVYLPRDARPSSVAEGRRLERRLSRLSLGRSIEPARVPLHADLAHLILFDYLVAHPGRFRGGPLAGTPDGRRIYARDHRAAFGPLSPEDEARLRDRVLRVERVSPWLARRLVQCGPDALETLLRREGAEEGLLDPGEMRGLLDRRGTLISWLAALRAQHGEEAVLSFP